MGELVAAVAVEDSLKNEQPDLAFELHACGVR
jgi:hypothetical protein